MLAMRVLLVGSSRLAASDGAQAVIQMRRRDSDVGDFDCTVAVARLRNKRIVWMTAIGT
jgi:hypothetical protein